MENKKNPPRVLSFLPVPGRRDELTNLGNKRRTNADTETDILEEFLLSSFLQLDLSRFLDFELKDLGCLYIKLLAITEEHIFT